MRSGEVRVKRDETTEGVRRLTASLSPCSPFSLPFSAMSRPVAALDIGESRLRLLFARSSFRGPNLLPYPIAVFICRWVRLQMSWASSKSGTKTTRTARLRWPRFRRSPTSSNTAVPQRYARCGMPGRSLHFAIQCDDINTTQSFNLLSSCRLLALTPQLMELQVHLKAASDKLKEHSKASISLSAGCELFSRYVTRIATDIPVRI